MEFALKKFMKALRKRNVRKSVCAGLAAFLTLLCYNGDARRSGEVDREQATHLMRQLASQVEAVTLSARERGERDPIGYAISFFSQGSEPRLIRVLKARGIDPHASHEIIDDGDGWFQYTRSLSTEDRTGVTLKLQLARSGFLGARSSFTSDLSAGLFFAGLCLLFSLLLRLRQESAQIRESERVRGNLLRWSNDAKSAMTQLAESIRATLLGTQALTEKSLQSSKTIQRLRDRIHSGLGGLHESRRRFGEAEKLSAQSHLIALKLEKALRDNDSAAAIELSRALQERMQAIRVLSRATQAALRELELEIEPWSVEADQAAQDFEQLTEASENVRGKVRKTTEGLRDQAQFFREISAEARSQ